MVITSAVKIEKKKEISYRYTIRRYDVSNKELGVHYTMCLCVLLALIWPSARLCISIDGKNHGSLLMRQHDAALE